MRGWQGLVKAPCGVPPFGLTCLCKASSPDAQLEAGVLVWRFIEEEACDGGKGREDVVQGHLAQTTPLSCLFLKLGQPFGHPSVGHWRGLPPGGPHNFIGRMASATLPPRLDWTILEMDLGGLPGEGDSSGVLGK